MFITQSNLLVAAVLLAAAGLSFYLKKLTFPAAMMGFVCALIIFLGTGYTGLILLASFFLLGTGATALGRRKKEKLRVSSNDSRRTSGQVFANSGAATLMAVMAVFLPELRNYFTVLMAAALSSATSDTLSSELGTLYGKRFYNCLTWKKEERGLDGVISLEGTFIGLLASTFIAGLYLLSDHLLYHTHHAPGFTISSDQVNFVVILLAGFLGNLSDSILGASLERYDKMDNNWVNFISTAIAICISCVLFVSFLLF